MSTFEGEQLAAEGIARATDATEPLSLDRGLELIRWCAEHNEVLDPDTVHDRREALGLPDLASPGAWGGLWRLAAGKPRCWITKVDDSSRWRKSKRKSQHAKAMQLYASELFW